MDGDDVVRSKKYVDLPKLQLARLIGVVSRVDDDEAVTRVEVDLGRLNAVAAVFDRQLVKPNRAARSSSDLLIGSSISSQSRPGISIIVRRPDNWVFAEVGVTFWLILP